MNTDLQIAQAAYLENIHTIAEKAGIAENYLELYGNDKAISAFRGTVLL